ncbi:MAG: SDR family NAD(P)-dependent oxidoreductase [Gemmatimonadaceae bacterium]
MFANSSRTLVTGASRPLGIELVRQCLERGDRVVAAARNPARVPVLADLRAKYGTLDLLALDPADAASVAEAMPILEQITESLDLLIVAPAEPGPHDKVSDATRDAALESLSATALVEHYRRHAVAPVLIVRTLLPLLNSAGKARVLLVNSWLASLAGKTQGGDYAVCASAAALNMLARALSHDLATQGIVVGIGNPGKFSTTPDAGKLSVPIEQSAAGLLSVIDQLTTERSGTFIDWTGAERAW